MKNCQIAVVGAGYISRFHFAAFRKLGADIRVVADANIAAARDAAQPFGAAVTDKWEEALALPGTDTVFIFTPTPTHAAIARAALAAGKHVVCEKTLSPSAAESLALARFAEERGRLLFTSYMKRFFPAVQKAAALVPALGRITGVYCRTYQGVAPHDFHTGELPPFCKTDASGSSPVMRGSGGGILVCGGSHVLDMLLHLAGEPSEVYARQFRRPDSDVDMMTHAMFGYAHGAAAHFEGNWHPLAANGYQQSGWDETFEITGTRGIIVLETPVWNEPLRNAPRLRHYDNETRTWTEHATPAVCPFELAQEFFFAQIAAGSQGNYDKLVGYRVDYLLEQAQASATSGLPVKLDGNVT